VKVKLDERFAKERSLIVK